MLHRSRRLAALVALGPVLAFGAVGALVVGAGPASAWAGDTTLAGHVTCNSDHVQVASLTASNSSGVTAHVTSSSGPVFLVADTVPAHGSKTETFTKPGSFVGSVTVSFDVNYPPSDSSPYLVGPVTVSFTGDCSPPPTTTPPTTVDPCSTSTTLHITSGTKGGDDGGDGCPPPTTTPPTTTPPTTQPPCSTSTTQQQDGAQVASVVECPPPTTVVPRCGVTIQCPNLPPAGGCDGPPVACNPQPTTTVPPTTVAPTTTAPAAEVGALTATNPQPAALAFTGVPLRLPLGLAGILLIVGGLLWGRFRKAERKQ